jgi:cellulose synthase (UDP-forming)
MNIIKQLKKTVASERFTGNAFPTGLLCLAMLYTVYYLVNNVEINYSIDRQLVIGWSLVALLLVIYKMDIFRRVPYRIFFILLAGLISFRYFIWRTTVTLIYTDPLDNAGMLLLYAAELYAFWNLILGMFINIWPVEHIPTPLPADPEDYPSVDVFIPTYTEPIDIVKVTAVAATKINYPKDKLNVYILNDGSTAARRNNPEISQEAWRRHFSLKRLASELGVHYLTRESNAHAKAGNLNHALNNSNGDLILILDCDHVPTSDILENTAGLFKSDDKLFLVQTPHFFINPSPVERNMDKINVPYESDMFFNVMQCGFNNWNASYFCGSAAVLRRSHLVEVGGVSGSSITEDAETSVVLHGKGYTSAYVNKPMICGLSPETFDDYILQRTRWCKGMLQIFILHNPIFSTGMTITQRLCYFNSCLFWFFSFSRLTFFLAPALFLVLGLRVYHATLPDIVAFAVPHLFAVYTIMFFFYGKYRLPFVSEIYESVQSVFLLPAIISVLMHPNKPKFQVTPKGKRHGDTYLNNMASTFFIVVLVNLFALPFAGYRLIENPLYKDVIILATSWCVYNIIVSVASLGAFWEKKQVRRTHRIDASGTVEVQFLQYNVNLKGQMKDVSLSGMGVELDLPFEPAKRDRVVLLSSDSRGESYSFESTLFRIIPRGEGKYFCGFDFLDVEKNYGSIVKFVYGDSRTWFDLWRTRSRPSGTLHTMFHFLLLGLKASRECSVSLVVSFYNYIKKPFIPKELDLLERAQRQEAAATVDVLFPQYKQTVSGDLKDISATGMGVELSMPFIPGEKDAAVLMCKDEHGISYSFNAKLYRMRQRKKGTVFCGFGFDSPAEIAQDLSMLAQGVRLKKASIWELGSRPKGLLPSAVYFFVFSIKGMIRGLVSLVRMVRLLITPIFRGAMWIRHKAGGHE